MVCLMVIAASKDAKLAILVRLKYGIQLSPLVVCQVRRQGCKELTLRAPIDTSDHIIIL